MKYFWRRNVNALQLLERGDPAEEEVCLGEFRRQKRVTKSDSEKPNNSILAVDLNVAILFPGLTLEGCEIEMLFLVGHECGNGAWNAAAESGGHGCEGSSIDLVKAGQKRLLVSGRVCDVVRI